MSDGSIAIGTQRQKIFIRCATNGHWPLIMSGDVAELGHWNLTHALVMYCQPRLKGGFEWTAQLELPLGMTTEYKFVQKTDRGPRWESGNNHRITVIPALRTIDADFRE